MSEVNRVVTLAERAIGFPRETDFELIEEPKPTPGDGQLLIRSRFVSVDPYMRGWMNEQRGYADPFEIGKGISAGAVGEIIESDYDRFKVGDFVHGMWGWQNYAVCEGKIPTGNPANGPVARRGQGHLPRGHCGRAREHARGLHPNAQGREQGQTACQGVLVSQLVFHT